MQAMSSERKVDRTHQPGTAIECLSVAHIPDPVLNLFRQLILRLLVAFRFALNKVRSEAIAVQVIEGSGLNNADAEFRLNEPPCII